MFKRSLTLILLSLASLAGFACDDHSNINAQNYSPCEELKCEQIVGGKSHICVKISGETSCKPTCLGTEEGANKAVCYSNGSLPPESRPVYSSVDTCAKDDDGKLYSASVIDNECKNGCNEATGLCNKVEEPDTACEELKCDQIVGGKAHICVKISGKASCKPTCLGTEEGANKAVCYSNESLPPESRPVFSSVDTCAKDDDGKLYSASVADKECNNGCNEDTGLCNEDKCSLSCINDGGDAQVCVKLSGKESCEDICHGEKVGLNDAVCYENGSLPPGAMNQFSVVTECAKDDLGTLYATDRKSTTCDNGCDNDTGLCKTEPDPTCEQLQCESIAGDGIAHICATIDGKAVCKNTCLGTEEGINPARCFSNGSLPPDARKFYKFVDNCAYDDNGELYSVSPQMEECPNGCYDNGECK